MSANFQLQCLGCELAIAPQSCSSQNLYRLTIFAIPLLFLGFSSILMFPTEFLILLIYFGYCFYSSDYVLVPTFFLVLFLTIGLVWLLINFT